MSFFEDYTAAVEAYPTDYVTLEIVNVTAPGTALNVGEPRVVRRAREERRTAADGRPRGVRVKGLNGALVKDTGAAAPFVTEFISAAGQFPLIDAHDTVNAGELTGKFELLAPAAAQSERDLVEVSVEDWTAGSSRTCTSRTPAPPRR